MLIALSILFPVCVMRQETRMRAAAAAMAYHGAASWPLIASAEAFFGASLTAGTGPLLWALATAGLSLPWLLLWTRPGDSTRVLRCVATLFCASVPPFGLLSWASPLVASGVLFSASGYLGLVLLVSLIASAVRRIVPAAAILALSSLLFWARHLTLSPPTPPPDWQAVTTHYSASRGSSDPVHEFVKAQSIQRAVLSSSARVIVFGEGLVPRWNEATELFWEHTVSELSARGRAMVLGAGRSIVGRADHYENIALIRGETTAEVVQRVPIPLGMWNPAGQVTVPLRLGSNPVVTIAGRKVAILICYEQVLPWTVLTAMLQRPALLVGISNVNWAQESKILEIQKSTFHTWATLFDVPYLSAVNQ